MGDPPGLVAGFVPRPWRGTNTFQEACWAWRRLPVPVVAAVHGHCYGGGLQIALAADFRIATPDSEWSVLEGRWGIIPDMSGVRSLAELVGIDTAKLLTMTAQMVSGKEADDLGLVTELAGDPVAAAHDLARELAQRSPDALAATKRLFNGHLDRLGPAHLRPRARRAAAPALRRQHQGGPRGRLRQGPRAVRAPPAALNLTGRPSPRGSRLADMAQTALGDAPAQTIGDLPAVGDQAPAFTLVADDLSEFSLTDLPGRKISASSPASAPASARRASDTSTSWPRAWRTPPSSTSRSTCRSRSPASAPPRASRTSRSPRRSARPSATTTASR